MASGAWSIRLDSIVEWVYNNPEKLKVGCVINTERFVLSCGRFDAFEHSSTSSAQQEAGRRGSR